SHHRRKQWLSPLIAPCDRSHCHRVERRFLLRHRAVGEGAPLGLENRRGAGDVDRAARRPHALPGDPLAAGLSALVLLRLRHHLPAPPAEQRADEGDAEMRLTYPPSLPGIARRKTRVNALMTRQSIFFARSLSL